MPVAIRRDDVDAVLTGRLREARKATDDLFRMVAPSAMGARPIPERHRILFYLGHFEAFDWNLLALRTAGLDSFNPEFDHLFAFGIDPVGSAPPADAPSDWPPVPQIHAYRDHVRRAIDRLLDEAVLDPTNRPDHRQVCETAVEHRLMHAETLTYMLHWLPFHDKAAAPDPGAPPPRRDPRPRQVTIPAGPATLGRDRSEPFGWDNEFEAVRVDVPAFRIGACNVTNGEFLEFVRAGGYRDRSLWPESDWRWKEAQEIEHPRFWTRAGDRWLQRTMSDLRPLPLDWPVYVSHAEASAYARWRSEALPTEAQIHRAAFGRPDGAEPPHPWGWGAPVAEAHGNFGGRRWHPVPAGSYPAGDSAFGVADLVGNGWEWTSTAFHPFPGFAPLPFYPGYSADFFDGRHFVMKGASPRTPTPLVRRTFRNWFQPHYPHIYAAFRCVAA